MSHLGRLDMVQQSATAAYIHIPFCRRRCYYCDFPVAVVGDRATGSTSGTIQRYVDYLCREIESTVEVLNRDSQPLQTVFLGGGTPSLLAPQQLDRILTLLDKHMGIASKAEVSMEMDPGTFDLPCLQAYLTAGINRVSLGVQAFQPELLSLCGRTHTVVEIYSSFELLQQAGVQNISLDLISGLPHQTLDHWQQSLESAIALAPSHLSCYDLIVEPKTAFSHRYQPGSDPLPTDAIAADMYRLAQQLLTAAGFCHYEISNYARSGYECRHNQVYWRNQPYYGFGMGSASYLQGVRFTRPRKTQEYYTWVEQLECQASEPSSSHALPSVCEAPDPLDTLMLGLRTAEGISITRFLQDYGVATATTVWQCLAAYQRQGLVELVADQQQEDEAHMLLQDSTQGLPNGQILPIGQCWRLQDPEGFLLSNTILADLFAALE